MPKVRTRIMSDSWLRQRELGQRFPLGHADRFSKELYSSILPCTSWDHGDNLRHARHGGVFNLEFSPDGSLLVAACEKKSILMFDPLCRRLIHAVDNAHRDCVNCVRFLDSRVFATCSDDSTVALWDARNLKTQIRTLHGHSNWVKNIEFSPQDGLLVTSGFDGSIYTWDINSYTESGFLYSRVFHTNGLMRTRLNPDASKMIICTTGGYLMIIHNLDLNTLAQDLAGFKPNMYRLMQLSQTTIPLAADFNHLFSRYRGTNRVEFVSDFPKGDDAEVVSSLQVHPQGWCALSRNISNDESSEWTCVHDIQDREYSDSDELESQDLQYPSLDESAVGSLGISSRRRESNLHDSDSDSEPESNMVSRVRRIHAMRSITSSLIISPESRPRIVRPMVELRMDASSTLRAASLSVNVSDSAVRSAGAGRNDDGIPWESRRRGTVGDIGRLALSPANVELHVSSTDVWEALVAIREARIRRERERERVERERERIERSVNLRIRMSSNSVGEVEVERRNMEDGNGEELRHGRVRILVRRNPEGDSDGNHSLENRQDWVGETGHDSVEVNEDLRVELDNADLTQETREEVHTQSVAVLTLRSTDDPTRRNSSHIVQEVVRVHEDNTNLTSRTAPNTPTTVISHALPGERDTPIYDSYHVNAPSRSDYGPKLNRKIHQNIPRLTHYVEEPNVGKGFIKELCFSADGRLICSPFGYGVRLLAFSPECSELSVCVPTNPPVKLYELATNVCHTDIVVSTKFSPQHCLLVSGCLSGKIVWHQPVV